MVVIPGLNLVSGIFSDLGLLLKIITVQRLGGEAVCRASQPSVHIFPFCQGVCSLRHVGTLGRRETDTDLCGVEAYVGCDN